MVALPELVLKQAAVSAAGASFGADARTGWRLLPAPGLASAARGNVLAVDLSFALTGSELDVNLAGVEEG